MYGGRVGGLVGPRILQILLVILARAVRDGELGAEYRLEPLVLSLCMGVELVGWLVPESCRNCKSF